MKYIAVFDEDYNEYPVVQRADGTLYLEGTTIEVKQAPEPKEESPSVCTSRLYIDGYNHALRDCGVAESEDKE